MKSTNDYKKQNTIAYDKHLREKLKTLHDMLGIEITDVAVGAMDYGLKFNPQAKEILKTLSSITSDFSVVLLNAKGNKSKLSEEEQLDYDNIKSLTAYLGNLQYKLNKIIQKAEEFNKLTVELRDMGMSCAEYIMEAQEQFRMVRANINDLAFMSADPDVAYEYRDLAEKESK
jgi:hypothetical protein